MVKCEFERAKKWREATQNDVLRLEKCLESLNAIKRNDVLGKLQLELGELPGDLKLARNDLIFAIEVFEEVEKSCDEAQNVALEFTVGCILELLRLPSSLSDSGFSGAFPAKQPIVTSDHATFVATILEMLLHLRVFFTDSVHSNRLRSFFLLQNPESAGVIERLDTSYTEAVTHDRTLMAWAVATLVSSFVAWFHEDLFSEMIPIPNQGNDVAKAAMHIFIKCLDHKVKEVRAPVIAACSSFAKFWDSDPDSRSKQGDDIVASKRAYMGDLYRNLPQPDFFPVLVNRFLNETELERSLLCPLLFLAEIMGRSEATSKTVSIVKTHVGANNLLPAQVCRLGVRATIIMASVCPQDALADVHRQQGAQCENTLRMIATYIAKNDVETVQSKLTEFLRETRRLSLVNESTINVG
jgi:hypothetical protein